MEQIVLTQDTLDKIKSDHELFGKVSKQLGISPMTLPKMILNKDVRLTQASVLRILREHLGVRKDSDLLEEVQDPIKQTA